MITVVLLGAGNVAQHLCTAFAHQDEIAIVQCYNRKGIVLDPNIPVTNTLSNLKKADIYMLCISDTAIAEVSEQLPFQDQLVVHTAGGIPISSISTHHRAGVWYPLQTFSPDKIIDFTHMPICIEATTAKDLAVLHTLAEALSTKIYELSSEQRNALHLAAVFVNNFTNHLYTIGNEICDAHQLPFEILHPLIQETAEKIQTLPPNTAQTGPAIRKDHTTITTHLERLQDPAHKTLYTILTKTIQEYHGKKL